MSKPHHDADPGAIEESGSKERYRLKPRAFNIVWGNDSRYWRIPPRSTTPSDNDEFAELVQVSWLEVTGLVKQLNTSTSYKLTFKLSFKSDAFGWSGCPVFLMAKVGKNGRYKWKRLKDLEVLPKEPIIVPRDDDPFVIDVPTLTDQPDNKLYFGLYEVWSGKWKGGLRVHEAIVKEIKKQ
ncbi:Phloem protein 2-like protein [Corchorus olitorius]|uniref:Phloem protein 2-like protein n=1 Tax=Corchorus olitorius TaxID=93759 RepID=A0A1R3H637_9ROSI|nr:Phloem protein 2-like protein [Corchorus olitorius]